MTTKEKALEYDRLREARSRGGRNNTTPKGTKVLTPEKAKQRASEAAKKRWANRKIAIDMP